MIKYDQLLIDFIKSQDVITMASFDSSIWIANMYFAFHQEHSFIFVSKADTKHSKQIVNNPRVAVGINWHNPQNLADRKGIQLLGNCIDTTASGFHSNPEVLSEYVHSYITKFPHAAEWLSLEYLQKPDSSRIYVIEPTYIKFWSDADFKEEKIKEYLV